MSMQSSPEMISSAHSMLDLLSRAFQLYEMPGVEPPEPADEGAFLSQYPQYLNGNYYNSSALVLVGSRESFEGLTPERQKLAASLICATFDEKDLIEIAGN